jgi:hypothetical protein
LQQLDFQCLKFDGNSRKPYIDAEPSTNTLKKLLILATLTTAFAASGHANSWGFTLGNGAGFYWGNQPRTTIYTTTAYVAPAPVYYDRPVVFTAPQTIYMRPYQQMRPVIYSQTVIYRAEPVVIYESGRRCRKRHVIYPHR